MKKVTIIGRGLDPEKHLSLAALSALKHADIVLGIEPESEAWARIRKEFKLPEITDIAFLYKNGAKDLDNYNLFIEHILKMSQQHQNVVLLVAGHPRLGVTFAQLLSNEKNYDFDLQFIEGISSFDVMLNDLGLDPLEQGTSLIDVNRLLLFKYQLEPATNYFFYHICSVGTDRVHFSDATKDNKLALLQEYLEQFFSKNKTIFLCKASNGSRNKAEYIALELGSLTQSIDKIDFGTTLFIPANNPTQIDYIFLSTLTT